MRWWPGGRRRDDDQAKAGRYAGDYLDLVPRALVDAAPEPDGDGRVVLLVPRYRDPLWGRLLQPRLGPRKRFVRVPLEARGSALWRGMDGRRSIRDLLPAVAAVESGDEADLARRVCLYVQALADNGFVAVVRPENPGDGASGGSRET